MKIQSIKGEITEKNLRANECLFKEDTLGLIYHDVIAEVRSKKNAADTLPWEMIVSMHVIDFCENN